MAESNINQLELTNLISFFVNHSYKATENDVTATMAIERCKYLCSLDYKVTTINNYGGELCGHYPARILMLNKKGAPSQSDVKESIETRNLMARARFARCRSRFVVPVILYDNKHICRSSTLASGAEMYGRTSWDVYLGGEYEGPSPLRSMTSSSRNVDFYDRIRGFDIELLRRLSVNVIFDLMVENKKIKFGLHVTSSEKIDKEQRYNNFSIIPLPYPGCEFFRNYKDNNHNAENLVFDWDQSYVDAKMDIPENYLFATNTDWCNYKSWDLLTLTKNYLKLLLYCIEEENSGVLIHCISGWDRTPLFVSLVRLSLWADGKIHQNLDATQILYMTIAYDWFLFGHQLSERLDKGEDIFYFCFDFLQHMASDDFCSLSLPNRLLVNSINLCSSNKEVAECYDRNCVTSNANRSLNGFYYDANANDLGGMTAYQKSNMLDSVRNSLPRNIPKYGDNNSTCDAYGSYQPSTPYGSWQLIPTVGSPKKENLFASIEYLERNSNGQSVRKERLDAVRRLFMKSYSSVITSRKQASVASYILDQLSSRVGSIVGGRGALV